MTDRLLTLAQVQKIVPRSRTTIYLWHKNGLFPKPIPVGASGIVWSELEIESWLADQKDQTSNDLGEMRNEPKRTSPRSGRFQGL